MVFVKKFSRKIFRICIGFWGKYVYSSVYGMLVNNVLLLCENHHIKRVNDAISSILNIIDRFQLTIFKRYQNVSSILLDDPHIIHMLYHICEYSHDLSGVKVTDDRLYISSISGLPENIIKDFKSYRDSGTLPDYCEDFIESMGDLGIDGTVDLVIGVNGIDFDFSSMGRDLQDLISTKLRYNRGSGLLLTNNNKLDDWSSDYYSAFTNILKNGNNARIAGSCFMVVRQNVARGNNFVIVNEFYYGDGNSSLLGSLSLPYEYDYRPKLVSSLHDYFDCFFRYQGRRLSMNFTMKMKHDRNRKVFIIELIFSMKQLRERELHVSK